MDVNINILKIKKFAGAGNRSGIFRFRHQKANALDLMTTVSSQDMNCGSNTSYKPTGSTEKKMTGYRQPIFKAK